MKASDIPTVAQLLHIRREQKRLLDWFTSADARLETHALFSFTSKGDGSGWCAKLYEIARDMAVPVEALQDVVTQTLITTLKTNIKQCEAQLNYFEVEIDDDKDVPHASAAERWQTTLVYKNWRDETSVRTIEPHRLFFGSNEWHKEPQWLIEAFDCEKKAMRVFALAGFRGGMCQRHVLPGGRWGCALCDTSWDADPKSCKESLAENAA